MLRWLILLSLSIGLFGCTKQADLPEITITASDRSEFIRFRSELGAQFPAERLQPFDTAVQELKLDAMHRNIASADERELDMIKVAHGKTVHAVTVLGWEARRERFQREIAFIHTLLEGDLRVQQNAGAGGPSATVLARIRSAQNLIAQLQGNVADTERQLAALTSSDHSL
jgi:hypothetical protein